MTLSIPTLAPMEALLCVIGQVAQQAPSTLARDAARRRRSSKNPAGEARALSGATLRR